jgi:hypothetical protein
MQIDWEEFDEGAARKKGECVHVTLSRKRTFFLNQKAIEALGDPDAVVLLYDRRRSIVGMRRSSVDAPNAFRLKRKEQKRNFPGRVVYAANFCRRYGIDPSETLAFTDAHVDKDGVLVLSLHEVKPFPQRRA